MLKQHDPWEILKVQEWIDEEGSEGQQLPLNN